MAGACSLVSGCQLPQLLAAPGFIDGIDDLTGRGQLIVGGLPVVGAIARVAQLIKKWKRGARRERAEEERVAAALLQARIGRRPQRWRHLACGGSVWLCP